MIKSIIDATMKQIEKMTKELGYELKETDYEVEDLGFPHRQPKGLVKGYAGIYIFILEVENGGYAFLKIGKANPKSNARFVSQHYGFTAPSTLAKSLCSDPEFISKGVRPENVKEWMFQKLHRINIRIKISDSTAVTELIEAIFHYKFRPWYEGNITTERKIYRF